jgi:hypothetical protein
LAGRLDSQVGPVESPRGSKGRGPRSPGLSCIGRARLCRGTSRALTEPLRVLYRGSVARDRRRCDHGFLRWGRRTQSNVCLLQHSCPLPAPPASLARPGAPFGTVKPPALAPSRSDAIRPPPSTPALPADNTRRYVHSFAGGPGPIGPARCGIHPSARNESSANFVLFAHPRAASWTWKCARTKDFIS